MRIWKLRPTKTLIILLGCFFLIGTDSKAAPAQHKFRTEKFNRAGFPRKPDPAEVALGERLFMETRFAQFYFANGHGDANTNLPAGDKVLENTVTLTQSLPGPFAGYSVNCRSCHMVKEQMPLGRGVRSYADFARRSPIPSREDGKTTTVRNAPAMVNASILRETEFFFHLDGEFGNARDLVKATMTGRNFGWLPTEQAEAIKHIAHIVRDDDGRGAIAREFGGYSYRKVFLGTDADIRDIYVLPEEFRIDVAKASDDEIIDGIGKVIDAYMDSLFFARNDSVEYEGSPYDAFLRKNSFPRRVPAGQSAQYYTRHLFTQIQAVTEPRFASQADDCFKQVKQEFQFNAKELAGLKIFFARPGTEAKSSRVGNCIACHTPPDFTDFKFHNTGASQEEYDALHGRGAFAKLDIPDLTRRNADPDAWLPATPNHPKARGPFLDIPSAANPGRTDLGLWNVFANPDQPLVQETLHLLLDPGKRGKDEVLLPRTIAQFKTPGLRGLSMSHPYLHNGSKDTIEDVIQFYIRVSRQARADEIRNVDPDLRKIFLNDDDVEPLAAFLRALNEDYE